MLQELNEEGTENCLGRDFYIGLLRRQFLRLIRDRRQKSRNRGRSVHSGKRNGSLQGLRRGRVRRAIITTTGILSTNLMFEIRLLRLHGHTRTAHAHLLRTPHRRRQRGNRRNHDRQQQRGQFGEAKHNTTIIPGCDPWRCDLRHGNLVTSLCRAHRLENSANPRHSGRRPSRLL